VPKDQAVSLTKKTKEKKERPQGVLAVNGVLYLYIGQQIKNKRPVQYRAIVTVILELRCDSFPYVGSISPTDSTSYMNIPYNKRLLFVTRISTKGSKRWLWVCMISGTRKRSTIPSSWRGSRFFLGVC
jgi:hypothetical protein